MKLKSLVLPIFIIAIAASCTIKEATRGSQHEKHDRQIQLLTARLDEAEQSAQLPELLSHYGEDAILMPEYQVTLTGRSEIRKYYTEMFNRQRIKTLHRQPVEFIHLNNTIVEIGTFKKEYVNGSNPDSLFVLNGKYWHIWEAAQNGTFKLVGEAFGYFNHVPHPEWLTVQGNKTQPNESDILRQKEIPFELKAYNALMEKGVKNRDGILRSGFFTRDARIFPFAEPTVTGIENIKPYLIGYSSRGQVTIDSVMCYTYHFKYAKDYVLEYAMFKVKWTNANGPGRTEGKGIRIWQRQGDNSLRLFREIGTHNLL